MSPRRLPLRLLALGLWLVAGPSLGLECAPLPGSESVLAPGVLLLLGEVHGTNEAPALVETLVCLAFRQGVSATVALEIPVDEGQAVQSYMESEGAGLDRARLFDSAFWQRHDGKSSVAMLRLLESMRAHAREGRPVKVVLIDDLSNADQRELLMAEHVKEALSATPHDVHIVLTGNLHSRLTRGVPWDASLEPMGYLLARLLPSVKIVALDILFGGGSAWNCTGPSSADCGPHLVRGPKGETTGITLFGSGGAFSGRCFLPEASASEPATLAR